MHAPFDIIDVHNHSLPNIDDGAKSLSMSLEMLRVAANNGTKKVILTPHHLNSAYQNFGGDILRKVDGLKLVAAKEGIDIQIYAGSEVHLVPETTIQIANNKALTYCGYGKAALIELPKHTIPAGSEIILNQLLQQGVVPIIAHPERNSSIKRDLTPLREWIDMGCKAQVTGQSCVGEFGPELQNLSFRMIIEGLVHLVASDAHRPTGRSPNLLPTAKTLINIFGINASKTLLHTNPLRLTQGKPLLNLSTKSKVTPKEIAKWQKKHAKPETHSRSFLNRLLNPKE